MGKESASPRTTQRYVVARVDEIPEGDRLIVQVAGREIGIFNIEGEFFAVRNRCPHVGGPLCEGEVLGLVHSSGPGDVQFDDSRKLLTCPWHGWEFDIKTGQSYFNPRMRARRFQVETQRGERGTRILEGTASERVPGPYEAEVLPVERDEEYIVVTMQHTKGSS